MTPTPEQLAILDAGRGSNSLFITAYAGCAKTTTLTMLGTQVSGRALALAFNTKIRDELRKRLPANIDVRTLNGLGHVAWSRAIGRRLEVDPQKLGKLVTAVLPERCPEHWWGSCRIAVTKAMQLGLAPSEFASGRGLVPDSPEIWEEILFEADAPDLPLGLAQEVLVRSVREGFAGRVSFDDQVYLPAVFGGVFTRYPLVFVDEAQDLSVLNHVAVRRSAEDRLVVVGDPLQSCYAFRGADHQSMQNLRSLRTDWIDLPLAMTFRCPRAIVARQQGHAPGFRCGEGAPQGEVWDWQCEGHTWNWNNFVSSDNIAVLCRNNAPLLNLAFMLLRGGTPVVMQGRDIGHGLAALLRRVAPESRTSSTMVLSKVRQWGQTETAGASARRAESVADRVGCIVATIEARPDLRTAGELEAHLRQLFSRTVGRVTLSTIHRAKGLEWDTVLHLDPWRLPSRYAETEAELQQEANLSYITETRTKQTLVLANLEDFS